MEIERRAILLIRLIVEAYLKRGGGGDWRFCLLASSILADIANNNMTEGDLIYNFNLLVNSPYSSSHCHLRAWNRLRIPHLFEEFFMRSLNEYAIYGEQ